MCNVMSAPVDTMQLIVRQMGQDVCTATVSVPPNVDFVAIFSITLYSPRSSNVLVDLHGILQANKTM